MESNREEGGEVEEEVETDEKEESMGLTRLHDVSAIEREGTELESVLGHCVCACVCVCGNKKENG